MEFVDIQSQRALLGDRIDKAIGRVLEHGKFILGPEVSELEERLAEFSGARHCVTCANGTDALVLALRAAGLRSGEGVIVPSFTFAATAEAIVLAGGVPIFADIGEVSFNLDPSSAERARVAANANGIDVVGVVPVDLFGHPADYVGLTTSLPGLWTIADAAQSFGARIGERRVGGFGEFTTTSFFPAKPLGCYGDGGAVFTDDDAAAALLRSLRVHGQGEDKYDNVRVGTNSRLDTIQAAILLVKLDVFASELEERQRVADDYAAALAGTSVITPTVSPNMQSSWAQYTVKIEDRDAAAAALRAEAIPTAAYYRRPLHLTGAYSPFVLRDTALPTTETVAAKVLALPMHPGIIAHDVQRVASTLGA